MKLIEEIARNCQWHKTVNFAWEDECNANIARCQELLPRGSGFDKGCEVIIGNSGLKRVHIFFEYHHINEMGGYCGWTSHELFCVPTFAGMELKITGPNKNGCKDYFYDVFYSVLDLKM